MFSKHNVILAAGLLSKAFVLDVSATSTVSTSCSVCTTHAVVQAYTVVASAGVTTTIGSAASVATSAASSSSCSFELAVNGTTALDQISDGQIQLHLETLGQISDGQIQSDSNLTASTFTISNSMVYDQAGRICSISGQNQSQFQCNYVPTTGSTTTSFSLVGSYLAFDGDTTFYACLLGSASDGYNIYQTLTGNQNSCSPITLEAVDLTNCATSTASTASSTSAKAATTQAATTKAATTQATSTKATSTKASSTKAATLKTSTTAVLAAVSVSTAKVSNSTVKSSASLNSTLSTATALPVASTSSGSNLSPASVYGLLAAAAFSLLML